MSASLKLSLCAMLGFLLGLTVGSMAWTPPDVKVWEERVVRYQHDSTEHESIIAAKDGEVERLKAASRADEEKRIAAVARADEAAQSGR